MANVLAAGMRTAGRKFPVQQLCYRSNRIDAGVTNVTRRAAMLRYELPDKLR